MNLASGADFRQSETMIRAWAPSTGLSGKLLEHLIYAVNEVCEAVVGLATQVGKEGVVKVEVKPFTQWVTVELAFPKEIPLDPVFNPNDPLLAEFPGMRVMADVFWRQVIIKWVDQAQWREQGKWAIISLTQYARRSDHAGELYFLSLTPKPTPGLKLDFVDDETAVAIVLGEHGAFRVSAKAAFVLHAVDGLTTVREIYAAYVKTFHLVHPVTVGRIVEDLVRKGLIVTGESLLEKPSGWWPTLRHRVGTVLSFQYSMLRPNEAAEAMRRRIGFLWSVPTLWAGLAISLTLPALLSFGFQPWREGFRLADGAHPVHMGAYILFYVGLNATTILHECAHAVTCRRFGGRIHAMGVMLYYFFLCAFVDTTDAWFFRKRWQRVMVSLAGPLTDLVLAAACAWGSFLASSYGHTEAAAVMGTLSAFLLLSGPMNLNPFLETDGYYILMDLLGETNLRKKAFRAAGEMWKKPADAGEPRLRMVRRTLPYALFAVGCVLVPVGLILLAVVSPFGQSPTLKWVTVAMVVAFALQRLGRSAAQWYRRTYYLARDLKVN